MHATSSARTPREHPGTPRTRLLVAALAAALAAGAVGAVLTLLFHGVQVLAIGYAEGPGRLGVEHATPVRRVVAPVLGALVCGAAWVWLRRRGLLGVTAGIREAQDAGARPVFPVVRTLLDAATQIVMVATGASLGREGAPRQGAAAVADLIGARTGVTGADRGVLLAAAAGAGLSAVYNVPLAGAVFALEVVGAWGIAPARSRAGTVLLCLGVSTVGALVAWPVVSHHPVYDFPPVDPDLALRLPWEVAVWALAAIPLCAVVGWAMSALLGWASRRAPAPGPWLVLALVAGAAVVGALSIPLPLVPGNGKGIVEQMFLGTGALPLLVALLVAKPLATAVAFGTGAAGGALTPSLATGAALGAILARLTGWAAEPGSAAALQVATFALVGAAGVLAVTQNAPLFAAVFAWELAHPPLVMALPIAVAALGAWALAGGARTSLPPLPWRGRQHRRSRRTT